MQSIRELDTRWYLDVNHFARQTTFAHGFMHLYALYLGVVLLGVCGFIAFLRARRSQSLHRVASVLWAGIGTVIAVGLNQPLSHAIGRIRPYWVLQHVEVLVPKAHDFTFPSDHATAAGAMIVGLLLSDRLMAKFATVVGLFLAFARVYVGAHYPLDVIGGLIWGGAIVGGLRLIALPILRRIVEALAKSPLRTVVESQVARGSVVWRTRY